MIITPVKYKTYCCEIMPVWKIRVIKVEERDPMKYPVRFTHPRFGEMFNFLK